MKAYYRTYETETTYDYDLGREVNHRVYEPKVIVYHNDTSLELAVIYDLIKIYGHCDGFDGGYDYESSAWFSELDPEDFDSFKADLKALKKKYHVR